MYSAFNIADIFVWNLLNDAWNMETAARLGPNEAKEKRKKYCLYSVWTLFGGLTGSELLCWPEEFYTLLGTWYIKGSTVRD